jgi:SAM-dependent methyltransferase
MSDIDYSIHYSRFHDDSEKHAEEMADWTKSILEAVVPEDPEAEILDIGCGFGFALRALKKLGFNNITGVESSQNQAKRCLKAGFNVHVTENTIDWLKHNSDKYSLVLLLDVLEHISVSSQIDFVRAVHGTLKPGGKLFLTVPNANAILSNRWLHIDFTHYSSFTEHSLFFVLKNSGFTSIQIDAEKGLGKFPKDIWRRSTWPLVRKWIVRWCWLQVFKAELPWEKINNISFELNLKATAKK